MDCNNLFTEQACLQDGCAWNTDGACHDAAVDMSQPYDQQYHVPALVVVMVSLALAYAWKFSGRFFPSQVAADSAALTPAQSREVIEWSNVFTMFLNGQEVKLLNPDPDELLVNFIRNTMELKGTKLGCEEGGCGCCTVTLTTKVSGTTKVMSVNSCLRPLLLNDGCCITTVEDIGSVADGLSIEQQAVVSNNGTQCGFCTPGWVSTMHALNQSNAAEGTVSSNREIEAYLDGNLCRCTGTKPLLSAFKNGGTDADAECQTAAKAGIDCCKDFSKCNTSSCKGYEGANIEDLGGSGTCSSGPVTGRVRRLGRHKKAEELLSAHEVKPLHFHNPVSGTHWYRPITMGQLCRVLEKYSDSGAVQLVGGNTAIGVTKYLNSSAPHYVPDKYTVFVDINGVSTFHESVFNSLTGELTVGAGASISQLISGLREHQSARRTVGDENAVDHSSLFSVTANHLHRIAGTQVRNAATWAGNLMTFLKYNSFPSDAVLALGMAGVILHCCDRTGSFSSMSIDEFMRATYDDFVERRGMFLVSLTARESPTHAVVSGGWGGGDASRAPLPPTQDYVAVSYKVAQRATNAHAHVNAGFQFTLQRGSGPVPTCLSARIVVGGVSSKTFVAVTTADFLVGKELSNATLQQAYGYLQRDLDTLGGGVSPEQTQIYAAPYLLSLMQGDLYRALLQCYRPADLPANLLSAVAPWVKPETRGTELFLPSVATEYKGEVPVGMPVHKIEAKIQTTGEAMYSSDAPTSAQTCFGAMVYATQAAVTLSSIDVAAAKSMPGVVAVYTADDIPGLNTVNKDVFLFVPVGKEVTSIGSPVGVVVATSEKAANDAAARIQLTYASTGKQIIAELDAAVAAKSFYNMPPTPGVTLIEKGNATDALASSYARSKGHISASGQNHMYMETQAASASVTDGDCVTVTCGTQDTSMYQMSIATALKYPNNKVEVICPRVGGAFGGKIFGGVPVAVSAALACSKLKRTVRIVNSRTADMVMCGGREAFSFDYEVGYTADGVITAVTYNIYCDAGNNSEGAFGGVYMAMNWADNAYYLPNYSALATLCYTNTPARTSMRAPGVVQSSFATEMVVERVAYELNLPLAVVQQRNFIRDGQTTILNQPIVDCTLPTVWGTLMQRSGYEARLAAADQYNRDNLWRKRGIAAVPVKYGMGWAGYNMGIRIGIRQTDGTVTIAHSGCEIGQGINTKVVQVVANQLGVDLSMVKCQAASTNKVVNGAITGGSGTSEVVCQAAVNACAVLNARLEPYRKQADVQQAHQYMSAHRVAANARSTSNRLTKLDADGWVKLLESLPSDVSLNSEGWFSPTQEPNGQPFGYFVYGAAVSEIELNVLTGEVHTLSSEIVYDCGVSLNPAVDIGQIEGAFVMGLGYFLQEKVSYAADTAALNTIGTWEYKPPNAQDVPSVFNVTLLKNMYNKDGIMGSKATGEPPYVLANSIFFATKRAIDAARMDSHTAANSSSQWGGARVAAAPLPYLQLSAPLTVDQRQQACMADVTPAFSSQKGQNTKKFALPY